MTHETPSSPSDKTERDAGIRRLAEDHSGVDDQRRLGFIETIMATALRLGRDGADTGELKLVASALKELRYAYRVFRPWKTRPKISIFGSARTPEDHADYEAAREFGSLMGEAGWMAITGAGDGIMKAGHEGPGQARSFGLRIRLPFETTANEVIAQDPKLINFRYFFTRKVMFVSHSQAIAALPGGFGTMDELFEALTLIQTGKCHPMPVILLEGAGGTYWPRWLSFVREELLDNGWISDNDLSLLEIAKDPADARDRVLRFYRNYQSSRYVGDRFVIRLRRAPSPETVTELQDIFGDLAVDGRFEVGKALSAELVDRHLPRLHYRSRRRDFGGVRRLIDRLNEIDVAPDDPTGTVEVDL
ncbi:MAG: TIGR00730 family Rossman fold protein [Planctomycetota bacterium]|nr:TIGR00730 family Rossman fold protein [Planctomycetota bacterium]